ncbi:MAG: hypothetical protein II214_07045 [Alistipes sp.]|nr:hypothetical protein [Alistipes sp.]
MKTILECRFMRILLYGTRYDYDSEKLLESYKEFHDMLSQITDGEMPYQDKYRLIKSLYEAVNIKTQKTEYFIERGSNLRDFVSMALRMMQVEIDLLEKQLQNPTLFPKTRPDKVRNTVYWDTKNFSKAGLVSLITAIDILGVCLDKNGSQASFISIVKMFEESFNVELSQPYKTRDIILGQGESRLKLLRQLLKALGAEL